MISSVPRNLARALFAALLIAVIPAQGAASPPLVTDNNADSYDDVTISLPAVPDTGEVSIEEAIWLRRSVRSFTDEAPSPEIVARLCWAAQGITDTANRFRSAPSAGATYPLELYLATPEYVARYIPADHSLEIVMRKDVRETLTEAALDQSWFANAPMVFIFIGELERTSVIYGDRAQLYVHIEVGCASENLMLQAAALGWGSVPVGAYHDDDVAEILELPDGWHPYLIVPVGRPAP